MEVPPTRWSGPEEKRYPACNSVQLRRVLCSVLNRCFYVRPAMGRAVVQTVSRWLSTTEARDPSQVRSCGICGGQSGTETGFLLVLRFPLPVVVLPTVPRSSILWAGCYNRPIVGRRNKWNKSHPTPRNKQNEPQTGKIWLCKFSFIFTRLLVHISAETPASLVNVFCFSPQSIQANPRKEP
jgi:hypothetical protein